MGGQGLVQTAHEVGVFARIGDEHFAWHGDLRLSPANHSGLTACVSLGIYTILAVWDNQ
ncbi:MAG: hypothetical protein Kow00106_17640 [Anaerolineae bacterium]